MNKLTGKNRGQGLVEYALLLTLVAVIVIGILTLMGPQIGNVFSQVTASLGGVSQGNQQANQNNNAQILNATALSDGHGTVTVTITLSENANITVTDQDSGTSVSGYCNTPCQVSLNGLPDSGNLIITAPGNSVTIHYDD